MPIIAPWLQPANVLGAMQAGGSLGLQRRAANQRDAEMAQRMQLAQMESAQQEASAAERLRYQQDALAQARELALADDAARQEQNEFMREQSAAKLLQDKAEADALAQYREGMLKNAEQRNAKIGLEKPFVPKFHNVGGSPMIEHAPGQLKIADVAGFAPREAIARLNIPINPIDTAAGRLSVLANDPIINSVMGTNAPPGTGTNFVRRTPKVAQAPVVDVPVDEDLSDEGGPAQPLPEVKPLDKETAAQFLKAAGGDKKKARELARQAGYTF